MSPIFATLLMSVLGATTLGGLRLAVIPTTRPAPVGLRPAASRGNGVHLVPQPGAEAR
jgi:hypothetical protein